MAHYSASQINTFLDDPSLWLLQEFRRTRSEAGPGAWRGNAVELACDKFLFEPDTPFDELVQIALDKYEETAQGDLDAKVQKERDNVPLYVQNFMKLPAKEWGKPSARQISKELFVDGIEDPLVMYLDYTWPEVVRDLKTTGRMPNGYQSGKIDKPDHIRQMAIYHHATKKPIELIYVTPGKGKDPFIYPVTKEEIDSAFEHVKMALTAMQTCRKAGSLEAVYHLYPPRDLNGFRWDDVTRQEILKVWSKAK